MTKDKRVRSFGPIEVRLDESGQVDEVLICDEHGVCLFHLERMTDNQVWVGLYPPHLRGQNKRVAFYIQADGAVSMRITEGRW